MKTIRHQSLALVSACIAVLTQTSPQAWSAQLPSDSPYQAIDGRIEAEAENYHQITDSQTHAWSIINEVDGVISNPQGGQYIKSGPNLNGSHSNFGDGPEIDYEFEIETPGIYRLAVRWDSENYLNDSLYFSIPELQSSGETYWYQDAFHDWDDFDEAGYDNTGTAETSGVSAPVEDQVPMDFSFTEPGVYTLRISMREDGSAVDAWRLDLESQIPEVVNDHANIRQGDSVRLIVTANDTSTFVLSSLEIVDAPEYGSVTLVGDGAVLYEHNGGVQTTDSFTYRLQIENSSEFSELGTVNIQVVDTARFDVSTLNLPDTPPPTNYTLVEAFPGITFNSPHGVCTVPGDTSQLFIAEGAGKLWVIPDVAATEPIKLLFLDFTDRAHDNGNEITTKSVAAHPDYANNGYVYVTYNSGTEAPWRSRLSRFTRSQNDPYFADPNTELILIDQYTEGYAHVIDTCKFGPDGYLYVSIGDEGTQADGYENSQKIDKDIWSTIIRIDVDQLAGNLQPNPHDSIPVDSETGLAHFSIPADNPFIGDTTFNGQAVLPAEVRTEMYMVGLRNPWQFDFIPDSTDLIIADVGRFQWEELSIIPKGGNGGWGWYEGTNEGPRYDTTINGASAQDADLTFPIFEYSHDVGSSITGGLIYTGNNYPDLKDLYIFSDYVSGQIWSIDHTLPAPSPNFITAEGAIVGFVIDPSNGDLLLLDRGLVGGSPGTGRLLRLKFGSALNAFPASLSETNFFKDLTTLEPNVGAHHYGVNLRFWSDHADKSRWFVIPDADDTVGYSKDGNWTFPNGMVLVKHFDLEMERGVSASSRRIETRFLVKNESGTYGVAYIWNDSGTEAYLAPESGADIIYDINDGGSLYQQEWRVPARNDCLTCHTETAGYALSFNTRQLNRSGEIEGNTDNFLTLLSDLGYLDGFTDQPNTLPRHIRPDETDFSIEARARSYLAVNCAYCHQPEGGSPNSWDGRPELKLWDTNMVHGDTVETPASSDHKLIVPADKDKSVIWNRLSESNGYARMPPLGSNEVDDEGAALILDWIENVLPLRSDYDTWRIEHFSNLSDPAGAPSENADSDDLTNYEEFLWKTDPIEFSILTNPTITMDGDALSIDRLGLLGRSIIVESSTDLGVSDPWSTLDFENNATGALTDNTTIQLSLPMTAPTEFFRWTIEEE